MATLQRIDDPTITPHPRLEIAPMHLGKRLLKQRTRLGIPLQDAALALQTDSSTVRSIEGGDSIPPRLSGRLRTYLAQLEARPTPAPVVPDIPAAPTLGDETISDDRPDDPPTDPQAFGAWVKAQRTARGWTHREFGVRTQIPKGTVGNLESGRHRVSTATRLRILAAFDPNGDNPADANPPPTHLSADDSARMRSAFLAALLDRKLTQYQAAAQIGAPYSNIRDMIKDPFYRIPVALGVNLDAWLNNPPQPPPTEAPVTAPVTTPPQIEGAASSPQGDDQPDIDDIDGLAAIVQDLETTADQATDRTPPPFVGEGQGEGSDLETTPFIKMFTHMTVRVTPPRGSLELIALLDKFPAYKDASGNQSRWFQSFDRLIDFAQATATQGQD